ncbi:MAG TPA: heavy metal translocating P-type ATPase [Gemmatimonadaceae bacterium]|nr:heavy metal translocating P-type ATPase [Gemmatimonadaceae bacterium]
MTRRTLLPLSAIVLIVVGAVVRYAVSPSLSTQLWMVGLVVTGAPVVWGTLRAAGRGRFATDVVASLSIIGAVALVQPLAGLVIVLMQTGGEALERFAEGRASAAVRALEEAAPRVAHRVVGGHIDDVPVSVVQVGDELLVRPGDLVPCDGVVTEGESELDTSSLTGEAAPVPARAGTTIMSGTLNGFGALRMRTTALAAESQYERIVHLVRTAQASKAPLQRLADRYAVWFTPITLAVCALVVLATHDWMRALAILVVATPCPLILATPVAIIGGINRAAKRHIIIRNGGALERLGTAHVAVFDKTGTLTIGKPRLQAVRTSHGLDPSDVLRWAAAVEEGSSHLLGRVIVEGARAAGLVIPRATESLEAPGQGVAANVEGHTIRVGARAFVLPHCDHGVLDAAALEQSDATLRAYVEVDGHLAAVIEYADEVRAELPDVLASLREKGIARIVLLSGDHAPIARALAQRVGIEETYGDLLPSDKAGFIERLRAEGGTVLMIGDGINDAPALTAADVGIALAAHGGGITAEAADVIILVDSLQRVPEVIAIGARTIRIALQSIWVGLGLSGLAMLVAAFGGLPPAIGAALQEVIDVAVILNALRSSAEPRGNGRIRGTRRRRRFPRRVSGNVPTQLAPNA